MAPLAITVSNKIWEQMKEHVPHENGKPVHPIKADYLKPVVKSTEMMASLSRWALYSQV
jgi:hypothetical protein